VAARAALLYPAELQLLSTGDDLHLAKKLAPFHARTIEHFCSIRKCQGSHHITGQIRPRAANARDIIPAMRKTIVLPVLLALGLAVCVVAQTDSDYSGWMKDIAKTKGGVKKGIESKSYSDVAEAATHMSGLFKQVGAFWAGRKTSDAVTIAKSAETASNDLAAAAKAMDDAKMQSSFQAIGASCGACHMAHRDGAPPNFTIK
jgi:cytochrome c556